MATAGRQLKGNSEQVVTLAKAGVQAVDFSGFRYPPE